MGRFAALFACLVLGVVGCSSADEERPQGIGVAPTGSGNNHTPVAQGGATSNNGEDDPTDPSAYPEGPYGQGDPRVGDVIEDLNFEGYRRLGDGQLVSGGAFEEFSLSELRGGSQRYAFVHIAKVWCASCGIAADDLQAQADSLDDDVLFLEVVTEGNDFEIEPTQEELDVWVGTHDLTVTTVKPIDDRLAEVFPTHEYVYIVDLETMTVDWALESLDTVPSVAALGLEALQQRL